MTLPSLWELALSTAGGMLLGIIHFGGLHWTVKRLATSRRPLPVLFASSLLRCLMLAALLLYFSGFNFLRLVVLLIGVMGGRMLVIWYSLRSSDTSKGEGQC